MFFRKRSDKRITKEKQKEIERKTAEENRKREEENIRIAEITMTNIAIADTITSTNEWNPNEMNDEEFKKMLDRLNDEMLLDYLCAEQELEEELER